MSAPFMPAKSFRKRKSLRDQLDRVQTLDDDTQARERYELLVELEEDLAQAKNFRWHAPASQKRQVQRNSLFFGILTCLKDHHLAMYTQFVFEWLKGVDQRTLTDAARDLILFPDDEKALAHQLSLFVTYVFKKALPTSRAANSLHIRTLTQYRDSMMYWSGRQYQARDKELPRRRIFNEMVQAMRYVQNKYGDPLVMKEKTWLGLAELRQLLDHEAMNNRCVELFEQHQVLSCIGRTTALRPGSLCSNERYARRKPLTWRNFQFTVSDESGKFNVRLVLDRLDIKHIADTVINPGAPMEHNVIIKLQASEPQNLIFSPAHRLLVIALRRGILQGIDSLDDLLAWDREHVTIRQEHLDDVVFFAGVPKGTALDYDKPLRSPALSVYLQRRGYQIGYTAPITWYSIRRRAATDMARRIGVQATRLFMGHAADSQTLERYYLNVVETLDNMGVLTDQGVQPGGHFAGLSSSWAPLALGKLDEQGIQALRGHALSQMTRRLIQADPDPPENPTALELKNYRRRAGAFALEQLVRRENEWQQKRITKSDMDQRRAALNASAFADEVLQRAVAAINATDRSGWTQSSGDPTDPDIIEDSADESGEQFVGGGESTEQVPEEEEDLESALQREPAFDAEGAIELPIGDEGDIEAEGTTGLQDIPYAELARSFMELILDNLLSRHTTWSQQDKTCALCQDDDTVDLSQRVKEYGSADKLDAHISGNFHHPVSSWRRRTETNNLRDNGRYSCPYCEEAGFEEAGPEFKKIIDLMRHIMDSSVLTTNRRHDELKASDGWYDDEFANATSLGPTPRSLEKHAARGTKNLFAMGIDVSPKRQLLNPEPYHNSDTIVRGTHDPHAQLSDRYGPFVTAGANEIPEASAGIPDHLKESIGTGYDLSLSTRPLPKYMQGSVVASRNPRSTEDDEDEDMEG
ncbi:hypothetical protein LTR37_013325 [Vermiconidia calcicola]|uniref:Uncharacterized protein n=1 Tax=Vermiconidia calcicola TaxID=1690605 RepID=A0ACC3MWM0_9PEZI|nr:hypothetical protein LTR37_013325 [Vermiconidia calcicola]